MNDKRTEQSERKDTYEKPEVQVLKLDQVIRGAIGSQLDADNTRSFGGL